MVNLIDFDNSILRDKKILKGEQRVYYSMRKYKNMVSFKILTDIRRVPAQDVPFNIILWYVSKTIYLS